MLHNCLEALANDDDSDICLIASLINWGAESGYADSLLRLAKATDKPVGMIADFLRAGDTQTALTLNRRTIPVLVGERSGLKAIKAAMAYRDFRTRPPYQDDFKVNLRRQRHWLESLRKQPLFDEAESLKLLADYNVPTPGLDIVTDTDSLVQCARRRGYPLVLKTAEAGIAHKSDVGGVVLNISDESRLLDAYKHLHETLGPRVLLVQQVTEPGVEIALGLVRDPLLGGLLMIGIGGTLIEILNDKVCVPVPSNTEEIGRAIQRLKCWPLLNGVRGAKRLDIDALIDAAVCLSYLGAELAEYVQEVDINPLLVSANGVMALDALIVGKSDER